MGYTAMSKAEFLTEFVNSVCNFGVRICNIVEHAYDYKVRTDNGSRTLCCAGSQYCYEFDTTIGAYRFRDKKYGPWTRWQVT